MVYAAIKTASASHPKPAGVKYTYGTAGFRAKASVLDSVIFRAGLLGVLRSKKLDGKTIGVMVTASHNPEADNGVKLVDPHGEMLQQSWEAYASSLANASDDEALIQCLENIVTANDIDLAKPASVVFARDTRPSGPALIASLEDALVAFNANFTDYGVTTTPQLHYVVRCLNTAGTSEAYGEPTEEGYYEKLATAFKQLVAGNPKLSTLNVDCANGVGAPKLRELTEYLGDVASINVVKDDIITKGQLNYNCGADFVKTQQRAPLGMTVLPGERWASLDGDADRIVFYYADAAGKFKLLDGDKIASLAAMFIIDLVKATGIDSIKVGVVQTAYANGSSTAYLTKVLKVPVSCVSTGVKHLHHEAEKYDVGVYFEANGHGTVLFSPKALKTIHSTKGTTPSQSAAIRQLRALTEVINQAVGDALSDLLLVEAILSHRQWGPEDWDQAYTDLPNRLVKVIVKDRHIFKTTNAEQQLLEPVGIQDGIDSLVAQYSRGRSFVRPSGTEDCVRVYAEAATREETDDLAKKVAAWIYDTCGGLGPKPL